MKLKNRMKASRSIRQKSATERQEKYDKLSPKQKIEKLDRELGKGVGATKQRERLKAQLKG